MPIQTDIQRAAAYSAAGLSASQQAGVKYGVPQADINSFQSANPGLTFGAQDLPAYNAATSTTPAPIAVSTITTPQTPLNVQAPGTAYIPPIASLVPPTTTTTTPTTTTAGSEYNTQLEALQAQLAGKDLDTASTKEAATAPYETQLNNINAQIAKQQTDALAHQEAALNSGETSGYASREAQNVQRTDAIQLMSLQALQAGIQGNITLAEQHAQTASDLKYGQITQDIETAKSNIYNNYDSFSPDEKKAADATLLRLDANDAFVKNAKEDQSTIFAMATTAAKNFPNDPAAQYAVQKALQTDDLTTAFNLIGKYQSDPVAVQNAILNQKLLTAQVADIPLDQQLKKAQLQKAQADAKTADLTNTGGALLQPYMQTSYDGTQYADLSSLTPSDKAKYAQLASANSVKPILDAATASKLNAMSVAKQNLSNISTSVSNILNNTQLPAEQGISNSLASFFGNSDIKSFNAWRTAVINNVQALAGGQGSGLRINQAEIDAAMKNDLPVITGKDADNLSSAQGKLQILNAQLDVWTKQLLGGGNTAQSSTGSGPAAGTDGAAYGFPGYHSDGKQWVPN